MKDNEIKGYRIVIISPDNYIHSLCFKEIAMLLVSSFRSNNISCDFTINEFSDQKINIILGYHLLNQKVIKTELIDKEKKYIPFQLEQLASSEFVLTQDIKFVLTNGVSVWDYSKENIRYLEANDIYAKYLPIGYHKDLEIIKSADENQKDIDILFYGSIGKRREKILNILSEKYKVKALFGVYGKERDDYIGRAKIVLNIHHYSAQLLEMVRLSYLLNNKIFLISEESHRNPYSDLEIEFSPYSEIISRCDYYLKNEKARDVKRNKNYVKFKKQFPMESLLSSLGQDKCQ